MSDGLRTFCRNCTAACGLVLTVDDGRILALKGDRRHPITHGYLCVKGRMSANWHNGEDRLVTAMARTSDGELHPVDTHTALDGIHQRLQEVIDEHGPRSLALYYGTGVKLNTFGCMALRPWLTSIGSPYLYSSSTLDQSAKWVTAGRMGVFATGRHPVSGADVVLVVGANPNIAHQAPTFGSHPQAATREAKARGAQLIVIDPRRTEFARDADLHLAIVPGEDASVLAAMIRIILLNRWHDSEFCDRFVVSLDQLREAVAPFTPELAAERAGLRPAEVVRAAQLFAQAERRTAVSGTGPDMGPQSNLNEHLVETLNVICGAYLRAGDLHPNTGTFRRRDVDKERVVPPRRTWEEEPFLWTRRTGMVGGEFPASRIPDEILEGGLRALVVVGGNPGLALGQPDKTLAALAQLDLLVVVDSRLTETARGADFVVPTKLPYERYDTTHLVDGLLPRPFAQLASPVMEAPPGVMDDWEVFWELARRAGTQLSLVEYVWGGGAGREYPMDMTHKPDGEELVRWLCESSGLAYDDLVSHPEGLLVDRDPVVVQPAGADDGARLDVCPPDVTRELVRCLEGAQSRPRAYRLAVRRMAETMNSAFREAAVTRKRHPVNYAYMSPADMQREGLVDGDPIVVTSDAGNIVAQARSDETLRPAVVSMSALWGSPEPSADPLGRTGAFTGRLVSLDERIETINYMPQQSAVPVDVRKWEAAEPNDAGVEA
jgi:anaerobic selenocysteine-containing dehydrogenase